MTSTPTLTLTGFLGRDAEIRSTDRSEWQRTAWDPITDGEVTMAGTRESRDWAKLSIAVHEGSGRDRRTTWYPMRAWDLDHHPDEARVRTARKGQRVEVEGYWEVHRYTDSRSGEEREFRYVVVTSFRPRPGRLLRPREVRRAA